MRERIPTGTFAPFLNICAAYRAMASVPSFRHVFSGNPGISDLIPLAKILGMTILDPSGDSPLFDVHTAYTIHPGGSFLALAAD